MFYSVNSFTLVTLSTQLCHQRHSTKNEKYSIHHTWLYFYIEHSWRNTIYVIVSGILISYKTRNILHMIKFDGIWCCGCIGIVGYLHYKVTIKHYKVLCKQFSSQWLLPSSETRWHWRSKVIQAMAAHLLEVDSLIWTAQRPYLSLSQTLSNTSTPGSTWAEKSWRSAQEDQNGRSFVLVLCFASGLVGW